MQLTHIFKSKCHNLSALFDKVSTLAKFCSNLEKQSKQDTLSYDTNKYLGDGFEFFIECLLLLHPTDNRLGIYQYKPNQINDNGVDGTGVNINLEPSVVQIKYRSNKSTLLTANHDHLANLFTDGMLNHNVVADTQNPKNYRHFVFTTAKGLHFYTDQKMFKSKVKCFGYDEIRSLVDNNLIFWDSLRQLL